MKKIFFALIIALAVPSLLLHSENIRPGDIQMKTISILDGLSSSNVTCIASDNDRHLWVGTDDGFNIINNGHVFPFTQYMSEEDTLRARVGHVAAMAVSLQKALIAAELGLLQFDNKTGRYREIRYNGRRMDVTAMTECVNGSDFTYLFDSASNCIFQATISDGELRLLRDFGENVSYHFGKIIANPDKDDMLILADDEKGVYQMSISSGKLTAIVPEGERIVAKSCILDREERIWISRFGKGLSSFSLDGHPDVMTGYTSSDSGLPSNYVNCVLELLDDNMAVSTDAGVCIINRKNRVIESVTDHEVWFSTALFSLTPLEIIVGTRFNGIHELRRTSLHFIGHAHDASGFSLPDEMIISVLDGGNGKVWLGTAGGGLYRYNEAERRLDSFGSTRGNQITSICNLDERNLLVVSRFEGLKVFNKTDARLGSYHLDCLDDFNKGRLDFEKVLLSNAADGSILILNLDGSCCRIKDGKSTMFQLFQGNSEEVFMKVFSHKFTNVLVGKRRVYIMDNRDELWAKAVFSTDEEILTAAIDDDCNIWYITHSAVYRYIMSTGETELVMPQSQGMRFVGIQCVGDQVWFSGRDRCLYCYSVKDKGFKAFTEEDGILPGNDFSDVAFRSDDAVYFAGLEGLVSIVLSENPVPLRSRGYGIECLTMAVDNKTARFENGHYILPKKYNRAILVLSVNSPSAFTPSTFRYEIVDKSGHVIVSSEVSDPVVSMGRLPSGAHSVRVSSFSENGWGEYREVARIYRTNDHLTESLGILILSIILVLLGLCFHITFVKNARERARMREQVEKLKNSSNDAMAGFVQNVIQVMGLQRASISFQLESMLNRGKDNAGIDKTIKSVLLQLSRTDEWLEMVNTSSDGKTGRKPHLESFAIDDCLRIAEQFKSVDGGNVKVEYVPSPEPQMAVTDRESFLVAINTFIINAFINKAKSSVKVIPSTTNLGYVRVSVIDDGNSYPGDYDDLFSSSAGYVTDGFSSMGLAAVRTRIESVGGRVSGFRNVDQGGSTFYVDVPVASREHAPVPKTAEEKDVKREILTAPKGETASSMTDVPEVGDFENVSEMLDVDSFDTKGQTLLIVDDEADVRDYLSSVYASKFKEIYLASDGKEGLEIARGKQPSIIVSDVKMPRMNGFEFCKAVKSDIDISHLPFILLTSLAESKSQEIGYKMGADVFIPKPFDVKMLYNAIQTQLRNRYEIKKRYFSSALPEITEEQTFSAADETFVLKLNKFINDNIGNPDLNIDMILSEMCVSRSTLFNKMNSIIGVSAARYIKNIRIERAKKLLAKTSMTIFEVASEVGFTESQYFSTVFKQETGQTPSQYRAQANR